MYNDVESNDNKGGENKITWYGVNKKKKEWNSDKTISFAFQAFSAPVVQGMGSCNTIEINISSALNIAFPGVKK